MTTNHRGFTIIEVMVVLAIAGIIILIVFFAIPTLQRNTRNTTYKSQAARVAAATLEHMNNNSGRPPRCLSTPPCTANVAGSDLAEIKGSAKLLPGTQLWIYGLPGTSQWLSGRTDYLNIHVGVKCTGVDVRGGVPGMLTEPARANAVVVVYAIENPDGSPNLQCALG